MLKAKQVADYLLSLSQPDIGDIISHLKLQKLLYYSQGFHLAMYNEKLFSEDIYAWEHGPVVKDLWYEYKDFSSSPIPVPDDIDFRIYTENQKELLQEIYSVYGQFSAWRLRDMTHEEPPWKDTTPNNIISDNKMKRYFETQIEE